MMGTVSTEWEDRINEILVEPDPKRRLSQFAQLMREKHDASDAVLTEMKKLTNNLIVDDPTKKTPKKKIPFLLQKNGRLVKFQELVSMEYNEIIEAITALGEAFDRLAKRENDCASIISLFNHFSHCFHSHVTSYLNFSQSRQPEMFGGLMEQLGIFLEDYQKKKNQVLGMEWPEDADTLDPLGSESHPQIPLQNAWHLNNEESSQEHNENTGDSEVLPETSGYVLPSSLIEPGGIGVLGKRKNYETVDTEQNTPPKVLKTIGKESIPDGRNIDDNVSIRDNENDEGDNEIPNAGNISSPDRANCSTSVVEEDEASRTSDRSSRVVHTSELDVARISDHGDDPRHYDESGGNDTERTDKGIDDDHENPPHEVTSFEGITYASVEGCPNIDRRDHDALHNPKRQYTGNIMNRYMYLAMRTLEHRENLRKQHCDALITDEAFYEGIVEPMKPSEQWFIQILYQQKRDHWILCCGERNEHAGFDICIYDSLKRDYELTKNNRMFLERLCGTRDLNVFKSKSTDIQAKGSNDSGPYVLAYASALLVGKNPGLCAIRDHRLVIRERIKETMIEMTSIPTLMIYAPPLYPRNGVGFCKYVTFVSSLCDFIGETSRIRSQSVRVTIYEKMCSNDHITRKYLYPSGTLPYASIIYHRATGTYFLISNIESAANSKQTYVYEVGPGTIAAELMETLEPPASDSPRPVVASLIPSYQTKSTTRRERPGGRKFRSVGKNIESRLSGIDANCIEGHPQKWDDSQTGLEKIVNSLILCAIKVLELTNFIQPEEFDVTFLERKFENSIENLFKFFTPYKKSVIEDFKKRIAEERLDEE